MKAKSNHEYLDFLKNWLDESVSFAKKIHAKSQKDGGLSIFTISSTIKIRKNSYPFLTPLRKIIHGYIGGAVVFSQTQAILLSKRIDGLVDQVLVDAEKKIGITLGIDTKTLEYFGLKSPIDKAISRIPVEMGNISAACQGYIKKSRFYEYKPNDIAVESVWYFLSSWFKVLSGKKVAIIGSGNIGFKLALKLVECGANVEIVRRDLNRGNLMANLINIVKPKSTIATAHYNQDSLQSSLFCNAIIGCTDGSPAVTWEMIQCMQKDGLVMDVGKGSINRKAVNNCLKNNIPIFRCDVSSGIDGFISAIQKNQIIMTHEMGRKEIEKDIFVVSGGFMGRDGEIVVDNFEKPRRIIGVADGFGDFKETLSQLDQSKIAYLKKRIKNE